MKPRQPAGYFHRVMQETPTQFWINNPTPEEASTAREYGAIGATTNPTYLARMLRETRDLPELIQRQARESDASPDEIFARAYREGIRRLLPIFSPLYEKTQGREGYVAVQGDPRRNDDAAFIVDEALDFRKLGPNVIVKVPATPAGARAMEALAARDIPTIATLGFSVDQALFMAEAYRRASAGSRRPVCYITYIAGILDEYLAKEALQRGSAASADAVRQAGCIGTRNAYRIFKERGYEALLMGGGARGPHHFTELVGGDLAITIGFELARQLVEADEAVSARIDASTPPALIDELQRCCPSFLRASREGSIAPDEFRTFGPVAGFQNTFLEGVSKVLKAIASHRGNPQSTAAQ